MILDKILENLKNKGINKSYTINNQSYSYKELYKFVCNLYHFLLIKNEESYFFSLFFCRNSLCSNR